MSMNPPKMPCLESVTDVIREARAGRLKDGYAPPGSGR